MERSPTVGNIGATLRAATTFVTEEPLHAEIVALLMLLELAEEEQAKISRNPSHWTSPREPKKS